MNKSDYFLICIMFLISFIFFFILNKDSSNEAIVYYENKEILKIDLTKDAFYTVLGFNGEVVIEVRDHKIGVVKETSPKHICSKMGFIDKSYQSLICLPNKIVIKINSIDELDAVVR